MITHMQHDRFVPLELFLTELTGDGTLIEHFRVSKGVGTRDVMSGASTRLERSPRMLLSALDRRKENPAPWALVGLSDRPHRVAELMSIKAMHTYLRGGSDKRAGSAILEKTFTGDLCTLRADRAIEWEVLGILTIRGNVGDRKPPLHARPDKHEP